jgi:transposase
LGRSRGGFTTKIHVLTDGLGNPLRLQLTAGQVPDVNQALALVEGFTFNYVIADRGYAAQAFYDWLLERQMQPVIPPHPAARGDRAKRPYDRWLYRERHLIECCINKLKHYRRIATRFDKLATRYMGFLYFAASLVWLR